MTDPTAPRTLLLPLLPLRDIVVFPEALQALFVGRPRSVAAVDAALKTVVPGLERRIVLSAQRTAKTEDPGAEDIHGICTIGVVKTLLPLQDNMMKVLVAGVERARILRFVPASEFPGLPAGLAVDPFVVEVEPVSHLEKPPEFMRGVELLERMQLAFEEFARLSKRFQAEVPKNVSDIMDPSKRADVIAGFVPIRPRDKQELLEEFDVELRIHKLLDLIEAESEVVRVQRKVRGRFSKRGDTRAAGTATEKAAPPEGGAPPGPEDMQDEFKNELADLEARLQKKPLTDEARERVGRELKKLRMMSMMSAEATVLRSYLDWVAMLPWRKYSEDPIDIGTAENILNDDHFGLEKVKERILEHLAVQKLVDRMKGPILCLVGPPGVGKTSLAKSIARATGREFVRLSLGGVRDEAEIRGHRRTYIGALPGKIIAAFKRAGSSNPVMLLDEIDKMSTDFRGDPAAALLEVLDPEQNHSFVDHYLDLDYDLSKVLFICTANSLQGIAGPLQDRLEIIRLSGYTDLEKMAITKKYLIPKQLEANGLAQFKMQLDAQGGESEGSRTQVGGAQVRFDDGAIKKIVNGYTRESGVRNLEREIGTCCRKAAIELLKRVGEQADDVTPLPAVHAAPAARLDPSVEDDQADIATDEGVPVDTTDAPDPRKAALRARVEGQALHITAAKVKSYLGTERFRRADKDMHDQIGVTNGLAWTQVGGELLMTEVSVTPGRGKLVITGKLGDVMQESAQAAMTYVRSRARSLGLAPDFYDRIDVHVHVPEGAVPKDGPSAGITLATSLVSAIARIPVKHNVCMTGEITLRGRVMPIGGLKEKALAAFRAGCTDVIIPEDNEGDLAEIPDSVRKKLKFHPVGTVDEVLKIALAVEDPESFFKKLGESTPVDVFDEATLKRRRNPPPEEEAKVH
jgi:ATP-dependent Lon protease